MSFSYLTDQLLLYIFEFLNWQDCADLPLACKRFSSLLSSHDKFWARECLRTYFSTQLDYISEFYESQTYCRDLKIQLGKIQGKGWKAHFKRMNQIKIQTCNIVRSIAPGLSASNFVCEFSDQLKNPAIPTVQLKRETVICSTDTLYQEHLSNVLYEDMPCKKNLCFDDTIAEFMEIVVSNQQELIDEIKQNKELDALMEARWYSNKRDQLSEDDFYPGQTDFGGQNMSCNPEKLIETVESEITEFPRSRILILYNTIQAVIRNYCSMVFDYLSSLDDTFSLLAEYSTRWTAFSYSMLQLNQSCQGFIDVINEAYEQLYPGYPSFPKFSIWRLMAKMWLSEVYEKCGLSKTLSNSFLSIIDIHREKLLKDTINNNFSDLNHQPSSELHFQVPKKLFLTLNTKKCNSMNFDTCMEKKIQNRTHPYFSNDIQAERKLLSGYLQNVVDLSLNEVNIHYIDCTDVDTNYPYSDIESSFLQQSCLFYEDQINIFEDSPDFFCNYLRSDLSFVSEILNKRTNTKLQKIQVGHCYSFLHKSVSDIMSRFDQESMEKIEISPDLSNFESYQNLRDFLFQIVQEQKIKIEPQITRNQETKLIQKLISAIEGNGQSNFRSNFKFICEQQQLFEQIRMKDLELKEYNMSKNIPYETGDIDSLFYDIDKNTDAKLIENLVQAVQKANSVDRESIESKSTKVSSNLSEDLPDLEDNLDDLELPQLKPKGENEFYDLDFDRESLEHQEFDEFDMPDLILSK